MAVTDNTPLFLAHCKMIRTRQKALQSREKHDGPEPIPPAPTERLSKAKLAENSPNFRLLASQARDVVRNVSELKELVLTKRKDFVLACGQADFSNFSVYKNSMTQSDQDQFNCDTDTAAKQCSRLISSLRQSVEADKSLREDELKHLKVVIQLLTVYLKDVTSVIAQLRQIYLKKTQRLQQVCRLANLVDTHRSRLSAVKAEEEAAERRIQERTELYSMKSEISLYNKEATAAERVDTVKAIFEEEGLRKRKVKSEPLDHHGIELVIGPEPEGPGPELSEHEQAQLMEENEKLYHRLASTNSEIQKIEGQMTEIRRLQDTFTEKVLEQEQEIQEIHVKTMHTIDNLEAANDFIRQAIQNSASRRVIMLFCLVVLTFTLLFLDWYNA